MSLKPIKRGQALDLLLDGTPIYTTKEITRLSLISELEGELFVDDDKVLVEEVEESSEKCEEVAEIRSEKCEETADFTEAELLSISETADKLANSVAKKSASNVNADEVAEFINGGGSYAQAANKFNIPKGSVSGLMAKWRKGARV